MKKKKILFFIIRLIVTVILLYFIYHKIDLAYIKKILSGANYWYLFLSLLIFIFSNITGAIQWFFLLKSQRSNQLQFFSIIKLYLFSAFFNNFLLTNVGGDVVKSYKMIKWKYKKNIVFSSIIWDRFISLLILIIFSFLAGFVIFKKSIILYSFFGFIFILLLIVLLIKKYNMGTLLLNLVNIIKHEKVNYFLKEFFASFKIYLQRSKFITFFYLTSFLTQFLKIYLMVFIAQALSLPLPFREIFFIIPIIGIVSALPISINGLGVREYIGSTLFMYLNKDKVIISIFITIGNLIIILGNLMGVIFMFEKDRIHAESN